MSISQASIESRLGWFPDPIAIAVKEAPAIQWCKTHGQKATGGNCRFFWESPCGVVSARVVEVSE